MIKLTEITRFSSLELSEMRGDNLMAYLVGANVLNNPKAVRVDELNTCDIVFYDTTEEIVK